LAFIRITLAIFNNILVFLSNVQSIVKFTLEIFDIVPTLIDIAPASSKYSVPVKKNG